MRAFLCFNSKLVRLKVAFLELDSVVNDALFQFQTGAIKRPFIPAVREVVALRFNSKLVRLKGSQANGLIPSQLCFNSKLVRLKDKIADEAVSEPKLCFNSKLVRLKVPSPQKGDATSEVSIPNWCD